MKIEITINENEYKDLNYVMKELNIDIQTAMKYGLALLRDLYFARGKDYIINRFQKDNVNMLSNIFRLGVEVYEDCLS